MLLSLNPRISIDPHAPPHQQHQQAQHHHHQAHQSHHRHEFFAQPSPLTPFGMHIHAGVGSDEQPRSAVAVSPACATPATPFAPPTTAAAAAAVAAFNLTVTAPHRALSTQFQQLNSNSSSSSRLQAPRPHRAAPIMASLVHLSSSPVQLFGSSPRPMHFSRSPSPPQLQTPMLSPNPLLTLPTTVGVSHGQRSPGNNCSILDGHQGRAAQFTPRVGGLLYCDEQIDAFVTAHDGGLASSPCIGQHGAAATAAAVAGSTPVSTTMQPQQQVPVLMRRTTSTRDEDSATSSSSAEVQASKQQTPARHDPTGTIAVDDIVQAPAPLSAAEIRTQEVAARMRGWWSTLGRYPALDAQTREHIRLLDSVMESACKEVMAWSGGGSGSEVGSGGIGSLQHQHYQQDPCPLEVAELSELMERVSSSFCTTGEKVVEHFVRIAQQCDEQQAALYDAANSGYLLYDTGSTTSSNGSNSSKSSGRGSSATKAKLSIHEPMRRRSKIPRTGMRSSPKSVAALDNAETSSDDDDDEEGQPAIVVVASSNNTRHRPKGVLLAKKPVTAAAAALTAVGGDSSSESDQETSRKRKQPASSTKRAKRAATETFTDAAVRVLRRWLQAHLDDPYPDAVQKTALAAETNLSYEQVQHWFINARMRAWRPMLRERAKRLEASRVAAAEQKEDGGDNCRMDDEDDDGGAHTGRVAADLADLSAAAASMSELVPKAGRSYMCLDEDSSAAAGDSSTVGSNSNSGADGASTPSQHQQSVATAELLAASALALSIATSFQTPHTYNTSHPLHRTGRKYKSGGSNKKNKNKQQAQNNGAVAQMMSVDEHAEEQSGQTSSTTRKKKGGGGRRST